MIPILRQAKGDLSRLVNQHQLGKQRVQVTVKTLTPQQAIGNPTRRDFPILEGREVIVEALFEESFGQAFTDRPQSFSGTIDELLNLELDTSGTRAIFVASLNALAAHLNIASGVRHCHDEEPERCGLQIASSLKERFGDIKIGMIGLQPAILQNLIQSFGAQNIRCTDLNPKNIGADRFGIKIWDGKTDTTKLINWCQLVLATSSSLCNGTFDIIYREASSDKKHLILFGITGAGVCALTGLERVCFFGH